MNARNIYWTVIILFIFFVAAGIYFTFLNPSQNGPDGNFHPQQTRLFEMKDGNNKTIDVQASTLPQFALKLTDQKFQNLWLAHAEERKDLVQSDVMDDSHKSDLTVQAQYDDKNKQVLVTPEAQNDFKPGLYHLNVKVKTSTGKYITVTQDFTWGVLAINTSKSRYQPGDLVKIGMGVLDNFGNTKCIANGSVDFGTAKVWLKVTSPSGKSIHISTDDGTIVGSKECAPTSITNNPDFQAQFKVQEIGKYTIHMTAENINGKRSVDDSFIVQTALPAFDVMRTSYPTRIYPYGHYPVEITVVARQNYSGTVSDFVPANFGIANLSDNGKVNKKKEYQEISWNVNWQRGQTYVLKYEIKFPLVSPEFYLVGPLKIGDFDEGRDWQIASDAIALAQTPVSNVVASGTTVAATIGSSLTANNLEIVVCSETGSATINTPTRGSGASWSGGTSLSVTSTPRIRMFYRVARATDNKTFTCNFGSSTGVKAIQAFEYSGLATSGELDGTGKLSGSAACNSSPFQAVASLTATNGNELVISSHVATGTRTVNSHTSGFTQEFAFNGTSGTFTSADQVIITSGAYSDTITLSGTGGTCSAVIASFITPLTLTQNGYRFFQNANSVTPGTPIDAQNTDITLATPHFPFRLRMLVDVDGNQTMITGAGNFILQYAVAPASGDCSTLQDTDWNPIDSTTPIAYNDNAAVSSNTSITSSGNDPTDTSPHTYTTTLEDYYDTFTGDGSDDVSNLQNALSNNLAGLWDFSLIDNTDDTQSTTFCFELVTSDGLGTVVGNLDSYLHYPKVTTFYNEVNIKSGTTIKSGTIIN